MRSPARSGVVACVATLLVSLVVEPRTQVEHVLTCIALPLITNEIFHAYLHNEIVLTRFIKLSPWPLVFGLLIAAVFGSSKAHLGSHSSRDKQLDQQSNISAMYGDSRPRLYGMFDHHGIMWDLFADQLTLMDTDSMPSQSSRSLAKLIDSDSQAFRDVLPRTLHLMKAQRGYDATVIEIAFLFDGFVERIDSYADRVPRCLVEIQNEMQYLNNTRHKAKRISDRFYEIAPMYDSLITALRVESHNVYEEMVKFSDLTSDLRYLSTSYDRSEGSQRAKLKLHLSRVSSRVYRSIRIIQKCREAILAYRVMLVRQRVVVP